MNVQILSTKLITPSPPTPHHLQNLKVSWIDQFYPPRNFVPLIFYYPSNGDDQNNVERSKQLQKSLSETLTIFYPLAGRYIDDNLILDCNDKRVEYVEAQVNGCLSQLLEGGELETELRNHLAPHPVQPYHRPLVLIQFNMFESGGVAIGVCVTHRVADAYTIFAFINAWATACKLGIDKIEHTPSFQLSSFFPSRETISCPNPVIGDNQKIVMKRFVFTGAALSKLKAVARAGVNGSRQPTRLEVVTAVIWKTLTMVARGNDGRLRPSILSHPINLRGKTAMPIPNNSCGNFATLALSHFTADKESKVQLHDFVDRVHNGIKKKVADCAKVSSDDELFRMATKIGMETTEAFIKGKVDFYIFKSVCRMPIYEANFGWGKPGWFSGCNTGVEMVFLIDTKDGDGIEAWLSLEENRMILFQENPDIKAFTGQGP
ncbi:unnamed protein product [Dovyalis caffra]|uniref:Uncharacterized protein n=1 Tax=Dovyalis caffra TaxID=77055 RepID=A0AAV1RMV0_9ROSI|nr:unnamed protein product [Dovyalis caffra]